MIHRHIIAHALNPSIAGQPGLHSMILYLKNVVNIQNEVSPMKISEMMTCRKMNGSGVLYVIKFRKTYITFSVLQNLHTHTLPPPLEKNGRDYKRERRNEGEARENDRIHVS